MTLRLIVGSIILATAAAASCRGAAAPLFPSPSFHHHSPFGPFAATTPALSVAGASHFVCLERRPPHILPVTFGTDSPFTASSGDLADAVVRGASCTRYTVQLTLPLPVDRPTALPMGLLESIVFLESLLVPKERGALRDLADYLRISKTEPFVYGKQTWISDNENVQLRFDPMQGDARLMIQYQLGL